MSVLLNPTVGSGAGGTAGDSERILQGLVGNAAAELSRHTGPAEGQLGRRAQMVAQEGFLVLQDPPTSGARVLGVPHPTRGQGATLGNQPRSTIPETGMRQVEGREEPSGGNSQQTARKTAETARQLCLDGSAHV